MSVATFIASKGFLIGAAGVIAAGAIAFGVTQAMGDDDPPAAPSPEDTTTASASATPTPTPKPTKTVVAIPTPTTPTVKVTAPTALPPKVPAAKLAISAFTVSPKDMYEVWEPSPNVKCHSTENAGSASDFTYAKLKATVTGSGVTSAKVTFAYKGHSGGGDLDKDDSTHWSQTVGGWSLDPGDYYTYSAHTVTWVLTVRDRQGHTATATRTNTVHGCHNSKD